MRQPRRKPWVTKDDLYHGAVICLVQVLCAASSPGAGRLAARTLGAVASCLSRDKRRRLEAGLKRWQSDGRGRRETRRIVRTVLSETWREILFAAEVGRAVTRPADVDVRGLEHLRTALAGGRGVILWESSGFGHRLASKAALKSRGYEVIQLHGANHLGGFLVKGATSSVVRDRIIRPFFDRKELSAVSRIVRIRRTESLTHLRPLIESLRQNAMVCMAADGRAGHRFVPREFLNHSLPFATGGVSLSRLTGAPLVPMFCYRPLDARPVLVLEPPVELPPGASRDEEVDVAAQRFIDLLRGYVERYPTQYRNWHLLDIESRT